MCDFLQTTENYHLALYTLDPLPDANTMTYR